MYNPEKKEKRKTNVETCHMFNLCIIDDTLTSISGKNLIKEVITREETSKDYLFHRFLHPFQGTKNTNIYFFSFS